MISLPPFKYIYISIYLNDKIKFRNIVERIKIFPEEERVFPSSPLRLPPPSPLSDFLKKNLGNIGRFEIF